MLIIDTTSLLLLELNKTNSFEYKKFKLQYS